MSADMSFLPYILTALGMAGVTPAATRPTCDARTRGATFCERVGYIPVVCLKIAPDTELYRWAPIGDAVCTADGKIEKRKP